MGFETPKLNLPHTLAYKGRSGQEFVETRRNMAGKRMRKMGAPDFPLPDVDNATLNGAIVLFLDVPLTPYRERLRKKFPELSKKKFQPLEDFSRQLSTLVVERYEVVYRKTQTREEWDKKLKREFPFLIARVRDALAGYADHVWMMDETK